MGKRAYVVSDRKWVGVAYVVLGSKWGRGPMQFQIGKVYDIVVSDMKWSCKSTYVVPASRGVSGHMVLYVVWCEICFKIKGTFPPQ